MAWKTHGRRHLLLWWRNSRIPPHLHRSCFPFYSIFLGGDVRDWRHPDQDKVQRQYRLATILWSSFHSVGPDHCCVHLWPTHWRLSQWHIWHAWRVLIHGNFWCGIPCRLHHWWDLCLLHDPQWKYAWPEWQFRSRPKSLFSRWWTSKNPPNSHGRQIWSTVTHQEKKESKSQKSKDKQSDSNKPSEKDK